ncbi:hypothetical protein B2G71_18790 [Novosphingobium sp. PC22D]|uniref:I78 family peptidase inhibitor n=1 Tax=Novosphingobium sp. PC22D TaxID=1962403 RepID=UPI000BFAF0A3|nr:I78 family peptidase inhibitor [Novosphingobium sp. PC22D]PEQ11087.1 hypothetical protein B2G71_18790 [Novosphingobium sp. PC22D]
MAASRLHALGAAGVAALALSACAATSVESQPQRPADEADQCGASRLQDYLGTVARGPVEARIREWAGDRPVRVIGPDDMVTMDFRPDRLDLETDAQGRITRIRCG